MMIVTSMGGPSLFDSFRIFSSQAVYRKESDIEPRPFAQVCYTLQASEWTRQPLEAVGISGFAYDASYDLMSYVDQIVPKEWVRMRAGLLHTGNYLLLPKVRRTIKIAVSHISK